MSTLEEVLRLQKTESILRAPAGDAVHAEVTSSTNPTLQISLQNNTGSHNVWAYITGLDINRGNAVLVLRSDGVTPYYPVSPSSTLSSLAVDCHIRLGAPGTTRVVTIPQMAGGRIWFCVDNQLTFYVNPGPALVEPSVMNPSDANYNLNWSFAEFTYNTFQLFANISYVDFISLPISLALTSTNPSAPPQRVLGHPASALATIAAALRAQTALDASDWAKLIIPSPSGGSISRILSPNSAIKLYQSSTPQLFQNYFTPYVSAVWDRYASTPLTINTQSQWGLLAGTVSPPTGKLTFPGVGAFAQPSAADIFSCDSGPFARYETNGEVMGNITARLAAAFNRNDVSPSDEENVAGTVSDGSPALFIVSVGGPAVMYQGNEKEGMVSASWKEKESDIEKHGSDLVVPRLERRPEMLVPTAAAAARRRVQEWAERAVDLGGPAVERGLRPVMMWLVFCVGGFVAVSRILLASRVVNAVLLLLAGYMMVMSSFGEEGGSE
ncbi:hypothetical protein B0T16DRAFT_493019 [Cercophora newfieldiana]|uniref:GH64 domain-containing protein n=1 Tax=Cercophora newfieldiana TaxID=92897 RepID=A0AA39Y4M7_9PEZI|nr:hypothetical protein B0T16DRAFT_493019 [Cercophora newfieldiana]